jgi:hypothetical protein
MKQVLYCLPVQWQADAHYTWLRVQLFAREFWKQPPVMFLAAAVTVPSVVALLTATVVLLAPVFYGAAIAYGIVLAVLALAKFIAAWRA